MGTHEIARMQKDEGKKNETEILMKTAAMNFKTTVKMERIAIGRRYKNIKVKHP